MARARNYGKLYKTYMKRYESYKASGKEMRGAIDINEFMVTYESMYNRYKELGYKTPTKNIIQNITNSEIYYDFSFKQAQKIKDYYKIEKGIDFKIYDIRHAREQFSADEFKNILKETYQKLKQDNPELFNGKKNSPGYIEFENIFFGADSANKLRR